MMLGAMPQNSTNDAKFKPTKIAVGKSNKWPPAKPGEPYRIVAIREDGEGGVVQQVPEPSNDTLLVAHTYTQP